MLHGIFDSHAHYDDKPFDTDRNHLLSRVLPEAGIAGLVNVGNDYRSIEAGIALAKEYDYLYCAVGHHPHTAKDVHDTYIDELRHYSNNDKVVAIGEIGLDYHYDFSPRDVQKKVFREQLALAKELDLPVIIHSREAMQDTLEILREFRPEGVVHCFSGSAESAKEIIKIGMYIGFTGVVTFKNAKKAAEAVAVTPLDRLLVETDCPYMAPEPHRGKRCDSTMLPKTIETIAAIKGITAQELADTTADNARRMYRIHPTSYPKIRS